jgi:hypothetical protein
MGFFVHPNPGLALIAVFHKHEKGSFVTAKPLSRCESLTGDTDSSPVTVRK